MQRSSAAAPASGKRDQQPAGGLRIVEQVLEFQRQRPRGLHRAGGELTIVLEAARDRAQPRVVERAGEEADPRWIDFERDAAGQRHLAGVSDQAEAGHVSAAVDVEFEHGFACRAVQRQHGGDGGIHVALGGDAALHGGGDDAGAKRLGENQRVAGARAGIGLDAIRMNGSGYRIAELDLVVGHAVAAEHGATGLAAFSRRRL